MLVKSFSTDSVLRGKHIGSFSDYCPAFGWSTQDTKLALMLWLIYFNDVDTNNFS